MYGKSLREVHVHLTDKMQDFHAKYVKLGRSGYSLQKTPKKVDVAARIVAMFLFHVTFLQNFLSLLLKEERQHRSCQISDKINID